MQCVCSDACLCDVVVESTAAIADINFATDSYHSMRIWRHLGLAGPLSDDEILRFFEMQCEVKDRMSVVECIHLPRRRFKKKATPVQKKEPYGRLTHAMKECMAVMVQEGVDSPTIRKRMLEEHGVDISPSYMSHLRKRLFGKRAS